MCDFIELKTSSGIVCENFLLLISLNKVLSGRHSTKNKKVYIRYEFGSFHRKEPQNRGEDHVALYVMRSHGSNKNVYIDIC